MAEVLQRDTKTREWAWAAHALPIVSRMSLAVQGPVWVCTAWAVPWWTCRPCGTLCFYKPLAWAEGGLVDPVVHDSMVLSYRNLLQTRYDVPKGGCIQMGDASPRGSS